MPKTEALVRLYPTYDASIPPDAFSPPVLAMVQDVTPERAAELLAFQPPCFTTTPPPTEPPAAPEES